MATKGTMKRRNFFKSLGALIGAASLSPTIFLPKFDPVRWKMITAPKGILVPNPAYLEAAYEVVLMTGLDMDGHGYWSKDLHEYPRNIQVQNRQVAYPMRYSLIDPVTFKPVPIPPFIKK